MFSPFSARCSQFHLYFIFLASSSSLLVTHPSHFCLLMEQHPLSCLHAVTIQLSRRVLGHFCWNASLGFTCGSSSSPGDQSLVAAAALPSRYWRLVRTLQSSHLCHFPASNLWRLACPFILLSHSFCTTQNVPFCRDSQGKQGGINPMDLTTDPSKFPHCLGAPRWACQQCRALGEKCGLGKLTHFRGQICYSSWDGSRKASILLVKHPMWGTCPASPGSLLPLGSSESWDVSAAGSVPMSCLSPAKLRWQQAPANTLLDKLVLPNKKLRVRGPGF